MLTLADTAQLGDFLVYRDVGFAGGVRTTSSRFYAIAAAPRLAHDGAVQLVRYHGDQDGGLLTLRLDLAPTAAEQAALRRQIADHYQLANADAVELLAIELGPGTAELSLAGDPSFGVAQRAAIAGPPTVSFAMPLTTEGAALVAASNGSGVLFARLAFELAYALDGIALHVWCDAERAARLATSLAAIGDAPTSDALTQRLLASQAAGVDLESSAPIPADQQAALTQLGQTLLASAIAQTIAPPPAPGQAAAFPPVDDRARLALNHTFTMTYPATAHLVLDGALSVTLDAAAVIDLQLDAGRVVLEATFVCPIDFGLVRDLHVSITYDATAGEPLHRETDFMLCAASPRQVFRFDVVPTQRAFAWRATVRYQDGTAFELPARSTDATVVVIDLAQLGVLAVRLHLVDAPLALVTCVVVDLALPALGITHQLTLDGGAPEATWQVAFADRDPGAYGYTATWVLADGRRIVDAPRESRDPDVFLSAPRELLATTSMMVIAAADFTDVAQLAVDLRADPSAAVTTLRFTEAGKPQTWSCPGAAAIPSYQARRTVIARDGTTAAFPYTSESAPILLVRDVSRFAVQLIARLLDLGGAYVLALVTLASDDAAPPVQDTLSITSRDDQPIWRFRLANADQHRYRVQLTLVARDGSRQVGAWVDADAEIFVLQPSDH